MQTHVGEEYVGPEGGGWCCGDRTVRASRLRLTAHPEIGICFRRVRALSERKRELERMTRHSPSGSWWRRVQYRVGFNRC
jgi:hypothetical protein